STLRMSGDSGFASPGEALRYTFGADSVESVRGGSGSSAYPYDSFAGAAQGRDRVTLGSPLTP
ncbi:MAG: hypothetical protein ACRDP2_02865, partial [Nocardioidaceae bacterium]